MFYMSVANLHMAHVLAQTTPDLVGKINSVIGVFQGIGVPMATLALTIGIGMIMFGKALPGVVQEQRGLIMNILILVFIFGMIPTLVNWFFAMGSTT
jgi:hypothetical protein